MLTIDGKNQLLAGAGLTAVFATTDAIFAPLAAAAGGAARQIDVQTARNDALLAVAEAYFNVQQARGRLAGARDGVAKATDLGRTVKALSKDLAPAIEVNRVLTELAEIREAEAMARQVWEEASADLTRELRLNPAAVVTPLEPPFIQVTLFSPRLPVDDLIPIGLTNRPELAAQQALVQAALIRIRQEKLRPLIPSIVLTGDNGRAAPGGYLIGGLLRFRHQPAEQSLDGPRGREPPGAVGTAEHGPGQPGSSSAAKSRARSGSRSSCFASRIGWPPRLPGLTLRWSGPRPA